MMSYQREPNGRPKITRKDAEEIVGGRNGKRVTDKKGSLRGVGHIAGNLQSMQDRRQTPAV